MNPFPWLLGLVLTACGGKGADRVPVPPPMDMHRIERPSAPNNVLAGPAGKGRQAVDLTTDLYPIAPERFFTLVKAAIARQPNTFLLADYPERLQVHYVVRSAALNFPDIVSIQVEPGAWPEQAVFTLYSRSVYGYFDFKANHRRMLAWLVAIHMEALNLRER
jgi:uncharacterized protein (DUF1499 family)